MVALIRPAISLFVCAILVQGCVSTAATPQHDETSFCNGEVTVGEVFGDVQFDVRNDIHGPVISFSGCSEKYFAARIKISTPLSPLEASFMKDYDALALRQSQALHSRGKLEVVKDPNGIAQFLLNVTSIVEYESISIEAGS